MVYIFVVFLFIIWYLLVLWWLGWSFFF